MCVSVSVSVSVCVCACVRACVVSFATQFKRTLLFTIMHKMLLFFPFGSLSF